MRSEKRRNDQKNASGNTGNKNVNITSSWNSEFRGSEPKRTSLENMCIDFIESMRPGG